MFNMPEISTLSFVPSSDVQDARYYRFRDSSGHMRECIVLYINNNKYVLYRKQISQLFRYLPAKISTARKIYEHERRDAYLKQALRQCDSELILSVAGNKVIRVAVSYTHLTLPTN